MVGLARSQERTEVAEVERRDEISARRFDCRDYRRWFFRRLERAGFVNEYLVVFQVSGGIQRSLVGETLRRTPLQHRTGR